MQRETLKVRFGASAPTTTFRNGSWLDSGSQVRFLAQSSMISQAKRRSSHIGLKHKNLKLLRSSKLRVVANAGPSRFDMDGDSAMDVRHCQTRARCFACDLSFHLRSPRENL
ncbi:uncharacterized protein UTRI_02467 [Ustilago trichophora]|uniref:Uncharacterized protein n=1 Tax=Ustilago trichophora TaxID=86804 RepID=A0A5C3E9D9_9BASI|nr:uncharacterized protein UTRI_02467 [Ustilago trichophora]